MTHTNQITRRELFLYALPFLTISFAIFPVFSLVIPFYSTELAIPLEIVGLILVLTRLTDVITDPIIGRWSDKTKSRFGRRKPFVAIGVPLMMLSVWMVFVPGETASTASFFFWMFVLYLAYTFISLPYGSWGAELSSNYDERSTVKAYRGMAEMIGTMIALSVPLVLSFFGVIETRSYLFVLAILFVVIQPVLFSITLSKLREPEPPQIAPRKIGFLGQMRVLGSNKPLLALCVGFIFFFIGLAIGASLNLIFMTEYLEAQHLFPLAIFLENLVGVLAIPLWVFLSKRYGKHIATVIAITWFTSLTCLTWLLGPGDGYYFVAIIALRGATLSALFFLGAAMMADVVDVDELESGEQRTGLFFGIFGMLLKLAGTLGVLLASFIPPMFGFQPSNEVHTPEALNGLRVVFAFVGAPFAVIAAILFTVYPLNKSRQQAIQADLEAMRGAAAKGN